MAAEFRPDRPIPFQIVGQSHERPSTTPQGLPAVDPRGLGSTPPPPASEESKPLVAPELDAPAYQGPLTPNFPVSDRPAQKRQPGAETLPEPQQDKVKTHLLGIRGEASISDPDQVMEHGTSWRAVKAMTETGHLPGKTRDLNSNYIQGDISVYPTPQLADVARGDRAVNKQIREQPERAIAGAREYADRVAKEHYILEELGYPIDVDDRHLITEINAFITNGNETYLRELGLSTERIEALWAGAQERRGVVIAFGPSIKSDRSVKIMEGDSGEPDLRVRPGPQGLSYTHTTALEVVEGSYEATKFQEMQSEVVQNNVPEEFKKVQELGYTIPTIPPLLTYEEVVDTLGLSPLAPPLAEDDAIWILDYFYQENNDNHAANFSIVTKLLSDESTGLDQDAIDYATKVAVPTLMALHADHPVHGYLGVVRKFVNNILDASTPPTHAELQAEIAQAISFVKHREVILDGVRNIFSDWITDKKNGTITSAIDGIAHIGGSLREDTHYLGDVDLILFSHSTVSEADIQAFENYVRQRLDGIYPRFGIDIIKTIWGKPNCFPINERTRRLLRDAGLTMTAPEYAPDYRQKTYAGDEATASLIENILTNVQ